MTEQVVDFTSAYDPFFNAKMDRRDRALRHIRSTLILEDDWKLAESCMVLSRFLTEQELVSMSYGTLRALPCEIALDCMLLALDHHGAPVDTLSLFHDEDDEYLDSYAKSWASTAPQKELKMFAKAIFIQMPPAVRGKFRDWINKKLGSAK